MAYFVLQKSLILELDHKHKQDIQIHESHPHQKIYLLLPQKNKQCYYYLIA